MAEKQYIELNLKTWEPIPEQHRLHVKEVSGDVVTLAGYGIVYGNPDSTDLEGEYFTEETNFWLKELGPEKPVLMSHGKDERFRLKVLGKSVKVEPRELGLWVEWQLNRHDDYVKRVLELVEMGVVGISSGAVSHLVRVKEVPGGAGKITSWPIAEWSLTTAPAEPRTIPVQLVKEWGQRILDALAKVEKENNTMTEDVKNVEQEEQTQEAPTVEAEGVTEEATTKEAEENHDEGTPPTVDSQGEAGLAEAVKEVNRVKEELDALREELKALKEIEILVDDEDNKEDAKMDEAVKHFEMYIRTGAYKTLTEGGAGGALVPEKWANTLSVALSERSVLRAAGARVWAVSGTDKFHIPTLGAGSAAAIIAEEGAFPLVDPNVGDTTATPIKVGFIVPASDEQLADSRYDVINDVLVPDAASRFAAAENTYFATGTGSGQPQGITVGSSLGVTAASNSAITADELIDLFFAVEEYYRANAVWLMSGNTAAAVRKLKDSNGQYLWADLANGVSMLMGKPVFTLSTMPAIGSATVPVVFGNLEYYNIVDFENGAVRVKRLEERYADDGKVGFRFYKRFDARVTHSDAIKHLKMAV